MWFFENLIYCHKDMFIVYTKQRKELQFVFEYVHIWGYEIGVDIDVSNVFSIAFLWKILN